MAKYRKRPIVIEAFQLTQTVRDSNSSWPPWAHAAWKKKPGELGSLHAHPEDSDGRVHVGRLRIDTLEGGMTVSIDDWIIQGVEGELYPCKPDIFAATYEPIA